MKRSSSKRRTIWMRGCLSSLFFGCHAAAFAFGHDRQTRVCGTTARVASFVTKSLTLRQGVVRHFPVVGRSSTLMLEPSVPLIRSPAASPGSSPDTSEDHGRHWRQPRGRDEGADAQHPPPKMILDEDDGRQTQGEELVDLPSLPPNVDLSFRRAVSRLHRVNVTVPSFVSPSESVGVTYIRWPAASSPPGTKVVREGSGGRNEETRKKRQKVPILLIHGFDCSSLEFRYLGPLLGEMGYDTYAPDVLGWGYSQLHDVATFSSDAKLEALAGFWDAVGRDRKVCVVGSSLGAALAVELVSRADSPVQSLVLISPQVFIDGDFMRHIPTPWARFCVKLLKVAPLRNIVDKLSFYDPKRCSQKDWLRVWKVLRARPGWEEAQVSFMTSGGLSPSGRVGEIGNSTIPTLTIWGENDGIIGDAFATKLGGTLPNAGCHRVGACGHFPHLEKPEESATAIGLFLESVGK